MLNRRDILKLAALTPATVAASSAAITGMVRSARAADIKSAPEIKSYKMLGKTGQKISDLSMGGGGLTGGPELIKRALELGVTYFDTAPDYGDSEVTIGRGWRLSGRPRQSFHITTKLCGPRIYPGHARLHTPEQKLIEYVEKSLKRLQTDYVDNLFIHALGEYGDNDVERLKDPEMLSATEKLKKAGKIRFRGCSSHGPSKPLECLRYAVESGQFDVIMPAYNLYAWPGLDQVLATAQKRNVGVIAMKTLRGGKQARDKGVLPPGKFEHSTFKWVWSNDAVAGLVITIGSISKLEDYASASGGKLASHEREGLMRMAAATSTDVCRIGCGNCLDQCPKGVSIPNVFRNDMYYTDYGDVAKARAGYAQLTALGASAAACATCTEQSCVNACTYGVPIRPNMLAAHSRLV